MFIHSRNITYSKGVHGIDYGNSTSVRYQFENAKRNTWKRTSIITFYVTKKTPLLTVRSSVVAASVSKDV